MTKIIDTNNDTTRKLPQLKARGIECVIRYISTNTSNAKVIKPAEARAIADAGLNLALVYETWGGANNFAHNDINEESGKQHGAFARGYAPTVGAPDKTIIYFAIDTDCSASHYEQLVRPYLAAARAALEGKYRIGVYACGFVCDRALEEGLVDATWLTQSMGFNFSKPFRDSGRWTLRQGPETTLEGLSVDSNEAHGDDYGAFVPFQAAPIVVAGPTKPHTGPTVPQQGPIEFPPIDFARLQQDIARLGQIAASLSQFPNQVGQLPTAGLPPQIVQIEQSVTRLGQISNALAQFATSVSGQPAAGEAVVPVQTLSPIDKLLGGSALVGLKTPIAIFGYLGLWILQSLGAVGTATGDKATTTGSVLTALFSGLGAAGVTAKFDRALQAASGISAALQKMSALPPATPPKAGV